MSARTRVQQACLQRVAACSNRGLRPDGLAVVADERTLVVITWGKETTGAVVVPLGGDGAAIHFFARVVSGVARCPGLMEHLLLANVDRRFGAFGMDMDGVGYQYALIGTASDDQIA